MRVRAQVNRVIVLAVLVVALPAIAVAERIRPGAGRRLARRAVLFAASLIGVRFAVTADPGAMAARPRVLVPNHSSILDIPAVLVACPDARFLMAAELLRIPLLGAAARALGCVPVDRGDRGDSHAVVDRLAREAPDELVVFPEGRLCPAGLGPFHTGAFRIAIGRGASIVPVTIRGTAALLGPRQRLKVRPGTIAVELLAPLPTRGLGAGDVAALRDRTRATVACGLGDRFPRPAAA